MARNNVVEVATAAATTRDVRALEGPRRTRVSLGIALLLLGIGAAAVAILGPLVLGVIDYHASAAAVAQVKGGDVAGLLLVAPVSLVAGVLVLRGRRLGVALGLGPAAYGLYMYFQLVVGGEPGRYPGNAEWFFPLLLGLFVVAGYVIVRGWRAQGALPEAAAPGASDRVVGWFLVVVAAFLVVGLHLRGLLDVWGESPGSEYLSDPVVFWVVKMMDLGIVVPILLAVGVGLVRGRDWARRLRCAVSGWVALLGSSVAGMAIVMQAHGDPAGSAATTAVFGAFAVVAIGLAVLVHRPLVGPR